MMRHSTFSSSIFFAISLIAPASYAQSEKLVIADNGGSLGATIKEAYVLPFEKSSGIIVTGDTQDTTLGPVKAQVQAKNVKWDVVYLAPIDSAIAAQDGLLEPINYSVVKAEGLRAGSTDKYRVAAMYSASVIGWNTKQLSNVDAATALFDLKKYPGKRAIRTTTPYGVLEIALMADGVAPEKLYPLDVDRAFAKLDTIKKDTIFYTTNEQGVQLLASGEASIGILPNGRAYNAKTNGQPIDMTFKNGVMFVDYWVVPKGAKNSANAMKFLNSLSNTEAQMKIGKVMAYGGNNPKADEQYDPKHQINMPTSAQNEPLLVKLDGVWWAKNLPPVFKRWQQWLVR